MSQQTKKGYCYTCHEEGHFTKDCPHYDSGSEEKQKAQIIKKKCLLYLRRYWPLKKDCPKLGELIQYSDIEEDEPPKKVMKITKKEKERQRNRKKKIGTKN